MSARIYADVNKANTCACGGKFDRYVEYEDSGIQTPRCNACNKHPTKFRIHVRIEDEGGKKRTVCVRHTQGKKRLTKSAWCVTTLETILEELNEGRFNFINYDSATRQKVLEFTHFVDVIYLPLHKRRWENGEISKSGWRNKDKSANHLKKYFKDMRMDKITVEAVRKFKAEYDATEATINYACADLKTILKEAKRQGYVKEVPEFENVKASSKRMYTLEYEQAIQIWERVEDPLYKDMIEIALIYPVRPSEIKALKWNDIDFAAGTVTFDEHFSDGELTSGRKSQRGNDKYSRLTLPLLNRANEIFQRQERTFGGEFIFKGKRGEHVSEHVLQRAWVKARAAAGIETRPGFKADLYEIKHALVSHLDANGVSIGTLEKMSGVAAKTLMERYLHAKAGAVQNAFNILEFREAT